MKTRILSLTALVCFFINLSAQEGYTVKKDSIQSSILKQNRKLSIFLPEGYDAPGAKFPVIYVLDGDGRCQHIVPTARFLFLNKKMPKAIVVSVINVDRNHDFLPTAIQNVPTGGGADNFIQFFKNELIPYIDKNFKTEHFNVLVGHSFGGVFAIHTLLNDPDLFDSYISIDPSCWYDNQLLVKKAQTAFLTPQKNWKKTIFITGRSGQGMKEMAISDMEKQLTASAPKDLNWKVAAYDDEDHGSVTFKSTYDGLRFIFDIGNNFMAFPQEGIIPKGYSTFAIIQNNNKNLRYTLDGSEPTINSIQCTEKIKIDKPCTLKIKSVSAKYNTQPAVTRVFKEGDFIDGLASVENLKPGLKYSYYEGVWDMLPDFSKLTPKKTGITNNIDMSVALKRDSFGIRFEGYLYIKTKALYNLWVVSDDGSKVYFNNQLILNNDGLHGADIPMVNLLPLNPGYYPIRIDCFENTGGEVISFGFVVGDQNPTPVSKEVLFYKD
jgi:predicted alpha/beta superfamily hydrolase